MKIPKMLDDYLESTEQNPALMNREEILEEAKWILNLYENGEWIEDSDNGRYTNRDAGQVKRFISLLQK